MWMITCCPSKQKSFDLVMDMFDVFFCNFSCGPLGGELATDMKIASTCGQSSQECRYNNETVC